MKIDRLMGIVTALQQNKIMTAPQLADMFEVSRRTISRDIETLCKSGIPILTTQGVGGGVSIMEGFRLDKELLTKQELGEIMIGLKTLDSVSKTPKSKGFARKIGKNNILALESYMVIDLSSFYKDSLSEKIEILEKAIKEKRLVSFKYYYNKGEIGKVIEPYLIVFKWSDWYVYGWCTERGAFRMYKLRRLWELELTDGGFLGREIPNEEGRFGSHMTDDYFITAIYNADLKYRLVEERGPDSFETLEDGRLSARWGFTDKNDAVLFFLGFGNKVEITQPLEFKELLKEEIGKLYDKYR